MTTVADKIVIFRLADDLFAADVQAVERVLRYQPARPVPNVPEWIGGVIDYQGRVVPVVDLRRRFELPSTEDHSQARTLVLNSAGEWIGAVVDAVVEVTALPASAFTPPPKYFKGLAGEYLRALVRHKEQLVILLDVDRLLSSSERITLERVAGGASGPAPSANG
jgi:purine-binding chemotaxis protein CheW